MRKSVDVGISRAVREHDTYSGRRRGVEGGQPLPGSANILYAAFLSAFWQEARSLSKEPLSAVEAEISELLVFRPSLQGRAGCRVI